MHGKIAHRKDKFWETNYPPNGWNCRCSVEFISKDEMDELGWTEMSDIEKTLNYADSDWAYDTRNLRGKDSLLQNIIEQKAKIYAKNSSIRQAFELLKQQVSENRSMYERIRGFYDEVSSLSKADIEKRGKECIFIAKTDERLREKLGTNAQAVRLSVDTLATHLKHENEGITAFDYALLRGILRDKNAKIVAGNKSEHIVYFSKYGFDYKVVLKTTQDKKEVYLVSLFREKAKE